MIVRWMRVSALEYVATWNNNDLRLEWAQPECRWRCFVNGKRVAQKWDSIRAAMDAVEVSANRVLASMDPPPAHQRPMSATFVPGKLVRAHA